MTRDIRARVVASLVWLVLLAACQPAGSSVSATAPSATPAAATASPDAILPTFVPPATRAFPTPELTPTRWPTPQIPEEAAIEQELDVPYTSSQDLDVYWPTSGRDWPVIILLHGGDVDNRSMRRLAMRIAGHGAVIFVPEYQSYEPPPDRITRGAEEAACALRFAKTHGPEYGGDSKRLIIVGHSAGGAFGSLVALAGDQFQGDCLVEEGDATPIMLIGLDGAYDLPRYASPERLGAAPAEEWLKISPYAYVDTNSRQTGLAFHLFVGQEVELLQDAQAFRDALQRAGYKVTLTQFPGIDHMRMASERHENTVWAIASLMTP